MTIALHDVTAENWRAIIGLERGRGLDPRVAPNRYPRIEAAYGLGGELAHPQAKELAISYNRGNAAAQRL